MNQDPTPKLREIPFDCDSYNVSGVNLSFLDSGGHKPPLYFYHANGFPVSVYLPMMIRPTERYRVIGLSLRGQVAQTAGNTSWHQVAEDLISFLDERTVTRICKKAENASSCLMEGAGHLIPMEKPNKLIHLIENFSRKS